MFKNKHKNLGFTLVELLVVIAIIGILSSVALINMQSARDKAKKTVILSDLGQTISAIRTCFADEENLTRPPAGANPTFSVGGGPVCAGSSATWPIVNRDGLDYYYYLPATDGDYDNGMVSGPDTGIFSIIIIEGNPNPVSAAYFRLYCSEPMMYAGFGQDDICEIYNP
ncbi:type II secretion system protein [Candidatus Parcubacteria bacterium]|jgi:prepilin-type N-terminal cleavage/methylation domain-containing protein|nr:type II secretion system protein [Candidatus Parcubacteria bacterium]MBT7228422.1 type II secretion system protein [Candidatus Parcubacteria bacterium]